MAVKSPDVSIKNMNVRKYESSVWIFLKAIVGWVGDEIIQHPCLEFLKFVLFSMDSNVLSLRTLNEFMNMFVPVTK